MNCHEAIDVMGDVLVGLVQGRTMADFQEHVEECGACGAYFVQLRLTREMLRALPRGATSPERARLIARFRDEMSPDD